MENKEKETEFLPCPNCYENLLLKDSKSEPFLKNLKQRNVSYLTQICTNCISNPDSLNEERMALNLMGEEWGYPEDIAREAARVLIEKFGKKDLPIELVPTEKNLASIFAV